MKTRTIYVSVLFAAAAVVAGSVAVAEPAVDASSEQRSEGDAPKPKSKSDKSPKEVLEEALFTVDRMEATADNISRMLRAAREQKDVVKTLCLDDKLNQIDVAVRSANDRLAIIQAAVNGDSTQRLEHDDAVLGALGNRAQELAVEANQCIGEEGGIVSDAELDVVVDPALPEGEVAQSPTGTGVTAVVSAPPQAASPTL